MSINNRRRVNCSLKCCLEGRCPPIYFLKLNNGTILSGNTVITGSELTSNRLYAQKINTTYVAPIFWRSKIIYNKLNTYGSYAGAPGGSGHPPKNVF